MNTKPPDVEDYELPRQIEPACPQCQYDLRGITKISGARCPECGAKLPFDKLRFRRDRAAQRRYRQPRPIRLSWPLQWTMPETYCVTIVTGAAVFIFAKKVPLSFLTPLWFILMLASLYAASEFLIDLRRRWQYLNHRKRLMRERRNERV